MGGFVGALYAFLNYIKSEEGHRRWDRAKLHMPVVGGLFTRITLGRFSRTFALVMRAGIPIEQALSIVSDAVGWRMVRCYGSSEHPTVTSSRRVATRWRISSMS